MSFLASYSKKYVLKVKILYPCVYPFSKIAVIWRDLTWPRQSPKFNLHHLRNTSTGFKMAVLTLKLGFLFSEAFYKKQTYILFLVYQSLVLDTVEVFCNSI